MIIGVGNGLFILGYGWEIGVPRALRHVHVHLDGHETFERSFELSKLPNLQEVNLGSTIGWLNGGLPRIPVALSTLKPATSSAFFYCPTHTRQPTPQPTHRKLDRRHGS